MFPVRISPCPSWLPRSIASSDKGQEKITLIGFTVSHFFVGSAWMGSKLHELSWLMGEPGSILLPLPDLGQTNFQTG